MTAKKIVTNNKSQLLAVFFAGMAIATVGWFFSDRLDIAFGQGSDINLIRSGKGDQQICEPGVTKKERKIEGCNIVISEEKCVPVRRHYQITRTITGRHISELANANRRSIAVTNFEKSKSELRHDIKQEMSEYMNQIKNKNGTERANLQKEYDELSRQARVNRCQIN